MNDIHVPTYDSMLNPLLQALKGLGGSGTVDEIDNKVAELMRLTDEQLEVVQNPKQPGRSKVSYRLAWSRYYLKVYSLLENSARGVWALTPKGIRADELNEAEIVRFVKEQQSRSKTTDDSVEPDPEEVAIEPSWPDELLSVLTEMDPSAFERLAQRLLRESGFIQVEVTGRSGDGGIDGNGIMRLGGLLSFHVSFQCKRYKGSVGASQVRDFRGAMVGRADKGLLITTGGFTKDAIREATRDGAPAIDLIDGDLLVQLLKEYSLGVITETREIEKVSIDRDWFLDQ